MGKKIKLLKKLKRMMKECDKDSRLGDKLKPWMDKAKQEGLTFQTIPAFIKEYEKVKKELNIK